MSRPSANPTRRKAYRKKNRQRILDRVRMREHGLSEAELKELKRQANGRCLICKRKRPLCLDHDHRTREPRGMICHKCNAAIGFLDDNPKLLLAAARYLLGVKGRDGI